MGRCFITLTVISLLPRNKALAESKLEERWCRRSEESKGRKESPLKGESEFGEKQIVVRLIGNIKRSI